MSQQNEIQGIHKLPLFGALAVVLLTLALVVGAVLTKDDAGKTSETVQMERDLYILDEAGGIVSVYDARTKQKLNSFSQGEGAFLRISMRSLMRMRVLKEIDPNLPFKLVLAENGNLRITDPASGENIRVNAFGANAIQSFAQFLPQYHSAQGADG
jgi:putative photosynthetic complex assembly protein